MRQNWRPHVVKRASSARITTMHTAAIAQAFATHSAEVINSLPQSSDGVNVSMPGSYPALVTRVRVLSPRLQPGRTAIRRRRATRVRVCGAARRCCGG